MWQKRFLPWAHSAQGLKVTYSSRNSYKIAQNIMRVLVVIAICLAVTEVTGSSLKKRKVEPIRRDVTRDIFISDSFDGDSFSFLISGDNGGLPEPLYSTRAQRNVAAMMARESKQHDCKFILELGDNFYYLGVKDVYDRRWRGTFEEVYSDPALFIPWYITTGNHDWNGSVKAQIDYSNISSRWTFPWYWYTLEHTLKDVNVKVRIVMFETTIPCGIGLRPDGVAIDDEMAEEQWKWLEQQLIEGQDADYLIVAGHYPVFSGGIAGPTNECLRTRIMPLFDMYRVSAYIVGHDHNIQHIMANDGSSTQHVIIGCSSDMTVRYPNTEDIRFTVNYKWPNNFVDATQNLQYWKGCFARADVAADGMKITFFEGVNGDELDHHVTISRRDKTVL